MIYTLKGTVTIKDYAGGFIVIEAGGVGYKCSVSAKSMAKISPDESMPQIRDGEEFETRIFTYMSVKEDAVELYGFYDEDELTAFKLLISISGIGPKAAISILSNLSPIELAAAIANRDAKSISRAQGVGGKTAERVVLELKDKMEKAFPFAGRITAEKNDTPKLSGNIPSANLADAREALATLGYSRSEIAAAMKNVSSGDSAEEIIKQCLAVLIK